MFKGQKYSLRTFRHVLEIVRNSKYEQGKDNHKINNNS